MTALACARQELVAAGLIAYQRPLCQVLALDAPASPGASPAGKGAASAGGSLSLGQVLRAMERSK